MKNRLPIISDKQKICIICEGNEDYAYLDKLNSLNVWNDQYEFFLDNAGEMETFQRNKSMLP